MSILSTCRKLLFPVVICFSVTATSTASEKQKCQAVGKLLITEYPELNKNSGNEVEKQIRSPEVIESVIKDLNLKNSDNNLISKQELLKGLTIETQPSKGIFYIYFRHLNSQLATRVVNSFMKNYSRVTLLRDKKQLIDLQKLVSQQIEQKQQELQVAGQILLELHEDSENKDKQGKIANAQAELKRVQHEYESLMEKLLKINVYINMKNSHNRVFNHAIFSCSDENI